MACRRRERCTGTATSITRLPDAIESIVCCVSTWALLAACFSPLSVSCAWLSWVCRLMSFFCAGDRVCPGDGVGDGDAPGVGEVPGAGGVLGADDPACALAATTAEVRFATCCVVWAIC